MKDPTEVTITAIDDGERYIFDDGTMGHLVKIIDNSEWIVKVGTTWRRTLDKL
jgi:hypothetical protein